MDRGTHPGDFRKYRVGFSEARLANRDSSIKIEFKTFSLRMGLEGRSVWWSEKTRNSCYMLDFDIAEARWIRLRFKDIIDSPIESSVFHRYRGKNAVFTIQTFSNKRGRFLELSKYNKQGRKLTTIVPSGYNTEGWRKISHAMDSLLSGCDQKRIFNQFQYGTTPKKQFQAPQDETTGKINDERNTNPVSCNNTRVQKTWKDALIITRSKVTSSWALVERVLGQAIKRKVEIFPFQANKALWWPLNHTEFSFYVNLRRGFFDFGVSLDFEGWSPDINTRDPVENCCNSWIWIYGLPWELWSPATFQTIGERCGGLLAISPETLHFRTLGAAKIKVKGTVGGFLQTKMNILLDGKIIELRIRVETFDLDGYEKYELQTYAQVVVNGKKIAAGWGNNNLFDKLSTKEVSKENVINVNSNHNQCPVNNSGIENTLGVHPRNLGEKTFDTQEPLNSKVQSNFSNGKSPTLPYKKKVLRILRKIDPKDESKFKNSPVESVNSQQKMDPDNKVGSELYNKFGKMYCRRRKLLGDEGNNNSDSKESSVKSIHSMGACRNIGLIDTENAKETESDESQDDMLEVEYESSENESFEYIGSAKSEIPEEEEMPDTVGLFSPIKDKGIIPNHSPTENSKPFVGQVLNGIQSSFTNHSFLLNAFLPSSFSALGASSRFLGGRVGMVDGKPGIEGRILTGNAGVGCNQRGEVLVENECDQIKGESSDSLQKEMSKEQSGVNYERGSSSEGSPVF